jgi:hypothetical protein
MALVHAVKMQACYIVLNQVFCLNDCVFYSIFFDVLGPVLILLDLFTEFCWYLDTGEGCDPFDLIVVQDGKDPGHYWDVNLKIDGTITKSIEGIVFEE